MNALKLLIPISLTAIVSVPMQTNTILTGGAVGFDITTSRILLHINRPANAGPPSLRLRSLMTRGNDNIPPTTATRAHDIRLYTLGHAFPSQIGINDNNVVVRVRARVKFTTLLQALTREKKS